MKKIVTNITLICMAILATFSISLTLANGKYIFYNSNSFMWIPVLLAEYYFIKMTLKIKNKRLYVICGVISIILSGSQIIGNFLNNFLDLSILIESKRVLLISIVRFVGCSINFMVFLLLIYQFIDNRIKNLDNDSNYSQNKALNRIKKISNKGYFIFIIWGLIFIAFIPYFIKYFPGNMTPDSFSQFDQTVGLIKWNNHHPVLHTFFIFLCSKIGAIFNNYNVSVAIYSLIQMIFVSGCFAFSVNYMLKKEIPLKIVLIAFLYYMIYPVHAIYSITMWKDIPFAACMLILTIIITDLTLDKEKFFENKKKMILLVLFLILVSLFRNNGIYVVILCLPFFILQNKKYIKKTIIIFGGVILFYLLWKSVFFKAMKINDGSIKEALSIPVQQLARTIKTHGDEMKEEDKQQIFKFFYDDTLGEEYNPIISDPVKNLFNAEKFEENKVEFVKIWFINLFRYPGTYIESFLCNSYGYWYPEVDYWVFAREIYEPDVEVEKNLDLHQIHIMDIKIIDIFEKIIGNRNIPIFSMMLSIGAFFYILIISLGFVIYIKKYNLILVFLPVLMLWLTCLASPVFAEFRYIYSLFTSIPIISTAFLMKRER